MKAKKMKLTINKSSPSGVVTAPPSKSMAHRLLICGGLSEGTSIIHGISLSQDVLATLDCLKALGAEFTCDGETVKIQGIGMPKCASEVLNCRESGSTLRFFLPLCMLSDSEKTLRGSETLLKRPLEVYRDICRDQGISFTNDGEKITVCGRLTSNEYSVPGDVSSQFITGLLFALPFLPADSTIRITPPIESLSYINMTLDALHTFGVKAEWTDGVNISIKGGQHYSPREVTVEGDYSNAAFFEALRCLGADVSVTGLNKDSLQGDRVYTELFEQLALGTPVIDISDCPDLGPILFAVAAAKNGGVFTGTRRLKIKESDRASAMAEELSKLGAEVKVEENSVTVIAASLHSPDCAISGHNDHRIVMSLAVLLTLVGGTIDGAEAVNKSMPDFFEKMDDLGVKIQYETL